MWTPSSEKIRNIHKYKIVQANPSGLTVFQLLWPAWGTGGLSHVQGTSATLTFPTLTSLAPGKSLPAISAWDPDLPNLRWGSGWVGPGSCRLGLPYLKHPQTSNCLHDMWVPVIACVPYRTFQKITHFIPLLGCSPSHFSYCGVTIQQAAGRAESMGGWKSLHRIKRRLAIWTSTNLYL